MRRGGARSGEYEERSLDTLEWLEEQLEALIRNLEGLTEEGQILLDRGGG